MSAREIAADLDRIGSPVTRADLERCKATVAEPLSVAAAVGTALQHAAAHAGARLADDPRAVRAAARRRGRGFRSRPWPGRGDQARVPRARPLSSPIRSGSRRRSTAISTDAFLDVEAAKIDRRKASPWRQHGGGRRHHLDGRGRRVRARRLLHPVALLGIRLGRRAAGDRRADAEPRRRASRSSAARSMRWSPAGCRRTRSIRRSRCCATAASWPTARMGGDAQPQVQATLFTRHVLYRQPLDEALDRPRCLHRPHLGLARIPTSPSRRASTAISSTA